MKIHFSSPVFSLGRPTFVAFVTLVIVLASGAVAARAQTPRFDQDPPLRNQPTPAKPRPTTDSPPAGATPGDEPAPPGDSALRNGPVPNNEPAPPGDPGPKRELGPANDAMPRNGGRIEDAQPEPEEFPGDEAPGWYDDRWVETPGPLLYGSAEYLIWWRRGRDLPPLVTTSPSGTAIDDAGVLPAASVLYGDDRYGDQARPGGRLTLGFWNDPMATRGVMGRAWFLETSVASFNGDQTEFPILARPFLDVTTGAATQNSLVTAFAPSLAGNLSVRSESDVMGGDVLMRHMIHISRKSRVDLLLGYQYGRIDENLLIRGVADPSATAFTVTDFFETLNEFHGGVVGVMFLYERPGWRLDLMAKVGLGRMHQTVTIDGSTNGDPGGLLARPGTNMGVFSRDIFSAVPEFNATWSVQLTQSLEFSAGYTFIFFPHVIQPGGAIDPQLAVNLSDPLSGAIRPTFSPQDNSYWIHGLNFGLTLRY